MSGRGGGRGRGRGCGRGRGGRGGTPHYPPVAAGPIVHGPPPPPAAPAANVYNPGAYGLPIPGGAIEHHNAFVHHVHAHLPAAAVYAPVIPTMLTPTPQEIALARDSPDGKPPIDALFPHTVNVWNEHERTINQSVRIIVNVAERVKEARIIPKCLNHKYFKGLKSYQRAFKVNTIAMAIKGEMYGYMRARSKEWDSLNAINDYLKRQHDHGEDIELYRHHTTFVIPVVRYLFNHVLNTGYPAKHYDVMASSTASLFTTAKRAEGGRCSSPIWTPAYWSGVVIQRSVKCRCDGHYLPFLLIQDEVVPDLVEAITNEYIFERAGENSQQAIADNRKHRKYPWAH